MTKRRKCLTFNAQDHRTASIDEFERHEEAKLEHIGLELEMSKPGE